VQLRLADSAKILQAIYVRAVEDSQQIQIKELHHGRMDVTMT